jgi:non-heme chloroperoxidase
MNRFLKGFKEGFFTTSDGITLRFIHKGEGKPLVVIPGWSGRADKFSLNLPALSEKYAIYALEGRGHGGSDIPEHGYRLSRMAMDVREFFLSLDKPKAYFMGHSMGCSVLWCYIDLFGQDSIEKLILIDQAPFLLANPADDEAAVRSYGGQRLDMWQLVNAFLKSPEEGAAAFARYFRMGLFPEPKGYRAVRGDG